MFHDALVSFAERRVIYMKDILLSNGLRILYYQMPNTHSITLGMYIKAGSGYEKEEQQGITHLLEHLHFRRMGKMSQDELYYRVESIGTNLRGFTYCDFLQYSMKIHPVYLEDAVMIFKELFYADEWTYEEFEREKQVVVNQIKESNSYFDINREVKRFIFRETLFEKDIMGTVEQVSDFKLNEVQDYKKQIFHKNNVCICITGCVNDKNIEWIKKELESWNLQEGNAVEDCPVPQLFHRRGPDISFYKSCENILDVDVAFDISRNPEEDELRNILNCILGEGTGSNLQKKIREELTYSSNIYSYLERYKYFEVLHICFSVEKQLFAECLIEIVEIIKKLKTEITDKELSVSLPFYTKNKIFLEDDTEEMNFQLAYQIFVLGGKTKELEENSYIIKKLKSIAQQIFVSNNISVVVAGNSGKNAGKIVRGILRGL